MTNQQALPKAANFGDLALNLDQNHEINAQLLVAEATKFNDKGNRFQECILFDGTDQQKVKVWEGRNGIALTNLNEKKWLTFNLSARRGTGKWANNVYYGGFWEMNSPVVTQAPPTASPAPQNRPQHANPVASSIVQGRPIDDKDKMICRQTAGKVAGEVVAAMIRQGIVGQGTIEDVPKSIQEIHNELLTLSDIMSMWFISGTSNAPEPQAERVVCQQHGVYADECGCAPF